MGQRSDLMSLLKFSLQLWMRDWLFRLVADSLVTAHKSISWESIMLTINDSLSVSPATQGYHDECYTSSYLISVPHHNMFPMWNGSWGFRALMGICMRQSEGGVVDYRCGAQRHLFPQSQSPNISPLCRNDKTWYLPHSSACITMNGDVKRI